MAKKKTKKTKNLKVKIKKAKPKLKKKITKFSRLKKSKPSPKKPKLKKTDTDKYLDTKDYELFHAKIHNEPSWNNTVIPEKKEEKVIYEDYPYSSDDRDLPLFYAKTYIRLLPRDPFCIHAYWEVAQKDIDELKIRNPKYSNLDYRIVIRIYDVTLIDFNGNNANSFFEIEVGNLGNWYIHLWNDNVSCIGEVGVKFSEGNFYSLARSNQAQTPRQGMSSRSDVIWMDMPLNSIYVVLRPTRTRKDAQAKRRLIYLSEEDIRNYYRNLGISLKEMLKLKFQDSNKEVEEWNLEGISEAERKRILDKLAKGYFIKEIRLEGSERVIFLQGASENLNLKESLSFEANSYNKKHKIKAKIIVKRNSDNK